MDGSEWLRSGADRVQEAIRARFRRVETGSQARVDHQRSTTNKICNGARNQSGVGGLPRSVTLCCIYVGNKHPDEERNQANARKPAKFREYQSYCAEKFQKAP